MSALEPRFYLSIFTFTPCMAQEPIPGKGGSTGSFSLLQLQYVPNNLENFV